MKAIEKPNKNASSRAGSKVDCIVLHIAQGSIQALHNWAVSANNKSSSWHYGIAKDGKIYHYCPNQLASWCQGIVWKSGLPYTARGKRIPLNTMADIIKNKYKGINPNRYCIGIEHEGWTGQPWTDKMYKADAEVIKYLCKTYNIPMDRKHIIGHFEINSVDRRSCPGAGFSFDKLFKLLNTDDDMYKEKYLETKRALEVEKGRANDCFDSRRALSKKYEALKVENSELKKQARVYEKKVQGLESKVAKLQKDVEDLKDQKEDKKPSFWERILIKFKELWESFESDQ